MVTDLLHDNDGTTDEEHEMILKRAAFSVFNGSCLNYYWYHRIRTDESTVVVVQKLC